VFTFFFFTIFLVVGSVRKIKPAYVSFRSHVKMTYRIVSAAWFSNDQTIDSQKIWLTVEFCIENSAGLAAETRRQRCRLTATPGEQFTHYHHQQLRWTSLQSGQNRRGPHVARQQQLSTNFCCPHPTSSVNPPAAAAAVDRRDRRTDTRPFYDAYRRVAR